MKFFLLSIVSMIWFSFSSYRPNHSSKTYFYFLVSKETNSGDGKLQSIIYTDIKLIDGDESLLKTKAKEWALFVEKHCDNKNGCTSDLNSYETISEANLQFNNFLSRYKDSKKYRTKKVDF